MRRPTAAAIGTVAGICLLLGAKLGTKSPADLGNIVAEQPKERSSGAPGSPTDPSASGAPSAVPHPPGASATPAAGSASRAPAQTGSSQPVAAPDAGTRLGTGTFTGAKITHRYGTIQVTITVVAGKITDAKASYTTTSHLSSQITGDAVPRLRQETLTAQSADIATVSGATYTSNAYRTSLQSALDRAEG